MTNQQPSLNAGLVYSLLSATCFGFLAIFFKFGYASNLTTGTMLSFRFLFAFCILLPYVLIAKRHKLRIGDKALFMACICGTFLYGMQSYFFAASLKYISAPTASLILYICPLTVLILSVIFLKSKITADKVLAIILIFCGCLCVFYDAFDRQMDPKGLLLATSAMLAFSCYMIFIQKSLIDVDSTVFSFYVIAFTTLQCMVIYRPFTDLSLTSEQWKICIFLALIPTVFAIVFLCKAIERIGSSYASIFCSAEPAVTVIASYLLLHDTIVPLQIGGMFFIIGGIIVPNLRAVRKK